MKSKKGITLVALVITIAIMLILAGVTISVSLKGGLFSKASEATSQMQIETEKEDLLTAALGVMGRNGKVDLTKLDSNLPNGFQKTGTGTYKSSSGNTYQVTEDADIILLDGTEEEPETPVIPPATPTIVITPDTITGEIESGTTEEVGTITATVTNVDGNLTWSITPANSGLELVDTDNVNVKKVKASKAVENATITVSYGSVSDTCSVTVTETVVGTALSGTWVFNDTLTQTGWASGTEVKNEYLEFTLMHDDYVATKSVMTFGYRSSMGSTCLYFSMHSDVDSNGHTYAQYHWNICYSATKIGWWDNIKSSPVVDFGSEPQEVSQEFYEWFTANATKQN